VALKDSVYSSYLRHTINATAGILQKKSRLLVRECLLQLMVAVSDRTPAKKRVTANPAQPPSVFLYKTTFTGDSGVAKSH
jgi:hypothetical protein